MKYATDLAESARQIFMSMPPASRVMSILLVVAIAISTAFLVRGTTNTSKTPILDGHVFSDSELKQAYGAFSSAGLKEFESDGNRILVPASLQDLYVKAMVDGQAFPEDLGNATDTALNSGNMFEPMATRDAKARHAKAKDVSNAISKLTFVDYAFVTYDERRDGFAGNTQQTAEVVVKPVGSHVLSDLEKRSIAQLVSHVYAGLGYENVGVTDANSGLHFSGSTDPMTAEQSRAYVMKRQVESDLKKKALGQLVGYGDVRLEVTARLDPTLREAKESIEYNEKPTTISSHVLRSDSLSERPQPSGRPGAETNAGGANQPVSLASANLSKQTTKDSEEKERRIAGHTATLVETAGLELVDASFSISIPRSYYARAWQREWLELNPGVATDTMPSMTVQDIVRIKQATFTQIEDSLKPLLPPEPPGGDRAVRIQVTDYLDTEPQPLPTASMAQTAMVWFARSWQTVGMFGLALVALFVMRSALKSSSSNADAEFKRGFDIPLDNAFDETDFNDDSEESSTGTSSTSKPRLATSGGNSRENLGELIQEDPAAAVNILRGWIGDAA
jgi:flagellar biosynthesis/type III secretory pathway M-ring protein FliF/YscJ